VANDRIRAFRDKALRIIFYLWNSSKSTEAQMRSNRFREPDKNGVYEHPGNYRQPTKTQVRPQQQLTPMPGKPCGDCHCERRGTIGWYHACLAPKLKTPMNRYPEGHNGWQY
jgi:hypothetical protein